MAVKYVATLLIEHARTADADETRRKSGGEAGAATTVTRRQAQVGHLMVALDLVFFVGSAGAAVACVVLLRRSLRRAAQQKLLHKAEDQPGTTTPLKQNSQARMSPATAALVRRLGGKGYSSFSQSGGMGQHERGMRFVRKVIVNAEAAKTQEVHAARPNKESSDS